MSQRWVGVTSCEPETRAALEPEILRHDRAMLAAYRLARAENVERRVTRTWAGDPTFEPEVRYNIEAADSIRELIPEEESA